MSISEGPNPTPVPGHTTRTGPKRRGRLAASIAGAGLVAGLVAAGIGGVAGAQTTQLTLDAPTSTSTSTSTSASTGINTLVQAEEGDSDTDNLEGDVLDVEAVEVRDVEGDEAWAVDMELSAEDEAVFDRYDTCLTENGLSEETFQTQMDTLDPEEIDAIVEAAFAACDPILEDLSEDASGIFGDGMIVEGDWEEGDWEEVEWEDGDWEEGEWTDFELSAEDEAVLDRFDTCLVENGLGDDADIEPLLENLTEEEIETLFDTAFGACDPILEELSEDMQIMEGEFFEGC